MAQTVKRLPAVQETRVQSLGREDPLEKGMATNSSILAPPPKKGLKEIRAFLVAQRLKHLSAMLETWVRSLGLEDSLEKEMAIHYPMDRGA